MAAVELADITPAIMDQAARRMGAADHKEFLAAAPRSMQGAFRLVCELLVENNRLRREEWLKAGRPVSEDMPLCGV